MGLFVVFAAGLDGLRPVELLQNHDPGQVMGEGHGAHTEAEIRPGLHPGREPEGGAYEKAGAALAGIFHLPELFREGFAGQELAFRRKDAQPGSFGDPGEDRVCLLLQPLGDFRRRGIFGEPGLRQLQKGEPAVARQPLGVLCRGVEVEGFLQLSHGDEGDVEHGAPP